VLVGRVVPVHGAEVREGSGGELLLQGSRRAIRILPPVEGLGDGQQTLPGIAFPVASGVCLRKSLANPGRDGRGAPPGESVVEAPRVQGGCGR